MPFNPQTIIAPFTVSTVIADKFSSSSKNLSSSTDQVLVSEFFRRLVGVVKACVKFEAIYSDVEGTQIVCHA